MNISLSWEAVIAICTALGMAAGAVVWFVRVVIREELAPITLDLETHKIAANLRMTASENRLTSLEVHRRSRA